MQSVAVLAVAVGVAGAVVSDANTREPVTVFPAWAYDVADDRYLVGAATHVFFGTVLNAAPGPPIVSLGDGDPTVDGGEPDLTPQTMYAVRAVGDIKGDLSTLTYTPNIFRLVQVGGYDQDGDLVLFEGDSLMTVGSTYLLVARRDAGYVGPPMSATTAELCLLCPNELAVTYFLFAPGFDHKPADDPQERAALTTRYNDAHSNQIDPIPLIEE